MKNIMDAAAVAILSGAKTADVAAAHGLSYHACLSHLHKYCRQKNPGAVESIPLAARRAPTVGQLRARADRFLSKDQVPFWGATPEELREAQKKMEKKVALMNKRFRVARAEAAQIGQALQAAELRP